MNRIEDCSLIFIRNEVRVQLWRPVVTQILTQSYNLMSMSILNRLQEAVELTVRQEDCNE